MNSEFFLDALCEKYLQKRLIGNVSFIGWLPFPGIWSFEVTLSGGTLADQTVKAHGLSLLPRIVAIGSPDDEF